MMEKNPRSTLFYVAVKLIDVKTKYYKDRRGLEQEEVEVLIRVNALGDSQHCSSFLVLTMSNLLLKDERTHTSCASLTMCNSG